MICPIQFFWFHFFRFDVLCAIVLLFFYNTLIVWFQQCRYYGLVGKIQKGAPWQWSHYQRCRSTGLFGKLCNEIIHLCWSTRSSFKFQQVIRICNSLFFELNKFWLNRFSCFLFIYLKECCQSLLYSWCYCRYIVDIWWIERRNGR